MTGDRIVDKTLLLTMVYILVKYLV
ncbi:protein of unknown function [Pseudotevenvirus RB43]|uniref:Uncharacterized protein n=2 Tax=Pseudotevenvirus RB43 TaxID=115991 RepID=Q56BK5_9CAUD|nr:hypothetical protein RB43ORF193c [Escherichia phage RB43]AAX78715.1 hypothetical protein RB43ORF193c [Escherichia phage RB43]CCK74037.1 protein of unknown function [Pseudotevenvirus RB43]CCL97654.1 protein of unknown function [Pseudotevenvirus RB43]